MKNNLSSRDLRNLSAYLDGELNAYPSFNRMKNRLARDPNLRATLDSLRETKSILQRTPKRRAPRNFTLTRQMVAKSPPMPRLVPALNYAIAFAMLLFFFSILPPTGFGGTAMAPVYEEVSMESADMLVEEPAEEEVAEEPVEEAMEAEVEEEYALADEEASAEAEMEVIEEPAPIAVPTMALEAEEAQEEPAPMVGEADANEEITTPRAPSEAEKAVAEDQAVEEGVPLATFPSSATLVATPNIAEIPKTLPKVSYTLWQEILLAVMILLPIARHILRRKAVAKWEEG